MCEERKGRGEGMGKGVKESVKHFGQLQEMVGRGGGCVNDELSSGGQGLFLLFVIVVLIVVGLFFLPFSEI